MAVSRKEAICQRKRFFKEKLIEILEEVGRSIERGELLQIAASRNNFDKNEVNSMNQALEAMLIRGTAETVMSGTSHCIQLLDKNVSVNVEKKKKSKPKKGKTRRFQKPDKGSKRPSEDPDQFEAEPEPGTSRDFECEEKPYPTRNLEGRQ